MNALQINLEPSAEYADDLFRVTVTLPKALEQEFVLAMQSPDPLYPQTFCGLTLVFEDFEFDGMEVGYGYGTIEDLQFSLQPGQEALVIIFNCPKQLAGDDRLDTWSANKALPELFWVEPARVIRALLGAVKH